MANPYKLLIIGGSAGSLEIIFSIVSGLQRISLPVIIVLHRREDNDNLLVELLSGRTKLIVKEAEDKEMLENGIIYVAPPDYHLLVENNKSLSLDLSERVNYSRPSINVCFETASDAYGKELICLLLSGANEDGATGLQKVKKAGGLTIVQDPSSAEVPYMPQYAISKNSVDQIISSARIPGFIKEIIG